MEWIRCFATVFLWCTSGVVLVLMVGVFERIVDVVCKIKSVRCDDVCLEEK